MRLFFIDPYFDTSVHILWTIYKPPPKKKTDDMRCTRLYLYTLYTVTCYMYTYNT